MKTNYANLNIAVLGAGMSGQSAAMLLRQHGANVSVLDSGDAAQLAPIGERLAASGIALTAGNAALEASKDRAFDLAVLSPGIDPAVPLVRGFVERGVTLTGELEMAYSLCECPVVAITGTNGKTTTTQLVTEMLNACGVKTTSAGNIGPAFSAKVSESKDLDFMTLEVSSFQLETIREFRPRVAVWLNFAADHLDRYASMEEYYAAKLRIFERQTPEDFAVVDLRSSLPVLSARRITFSAFAEGADFSFRDGVIFHHSQAVLSLADTQLHGAHNAENLMAAMGVGRALGLGFEQMRTPLCAYRPLAHRCEKIRELDGVLWVNDSKATNLHALEAALAGETSRVVLIAGGKDKGFEFDSIAELVGRKARVAVLLGEMAARIESSWAAHVPCKNVGYSLSAAVDAARSAAQPGDVILFSPGTSSFDMFKNYADRGNQFRSLVQTL